MPSRFSIAGAHRGTLLRSGFSPYLKVKEHTCQPPENISGNWIGQIQLNHHSRLHLIICNYPIYSIVRDRYGIVASSQELTNVEMRECGLCGKLNLSHGSY